MSPFFVLVLMGFDWKISSVRVWSEGNGRQGCPAPHQHGQGALTGGEEQGEHRALLWACREVNYEVSQEVH